MSSKVVGGGGGIAGARKFNNGIHDIPSGCRKMVQSLKEIVNSPENEIYAMLKECNMDPNETVSRLLSQDPFHEVKSKKEKKKETIRDIPDSRLRGANNTYNRGVRSGVSDRYVGRSGSTHFSSNDSGTVQGKSISKKESGTPGYSGSWSSASGVVNNHQTPHSDSVATENNLPSVNSGDVTSQSVSGHQTAWFGAPGQKSMADIVKMGRPQNKTINSRQNVNIRSEINHEREVSANQQVPVKDGWPSIKKPVAPSTSSVSVAPAESEISNGPADFQSNKEDQHVKDRLENIHLAENDPEENLGVQEDDSGILSEFDDNGYKYQTQNHPVEHHKDEDDGSSGLADFQQLTINGHDQEAASRIEGRAAVVIPDHLLSHAEECSQLSFGSFGSRPLSNNVEETSDVPLQNEHSDTRNTEFYGNEHLGSTANGNMVHAPNTGNYEESLDSRREVSKQENAETAQEQQYTFAQSDQRYAYENAKQQLMQGYTHSISNTLLAQSARELEFQYAPFLAAQTMQSRNSNNASSLGGESISMPEALRGSGIPATQQTLPGGANIATVPALPQQLPMHPYSQLTMPTHYANMLSYPLMPQNYPYMPSAFQQTFAGNSAYHQQLAALLPQHRTNLSPSSLPQSATVTASAYEFGNPTNVGTAGNLPLNQQSAPPTGTTLGYEDASNHLLALEQQQHNENSAMWHHGSPTMSGVPANTYYNLQAQQAQQQTQQVYRQAQQQQHYGSHGYPNFYQSQTEMSLDRQPQQNPRDGTGSQVGQPSPNQTQQLWQNSY